MLTAEQHRKWPGTKLYRRFAWLRATWWAYLARAQPWPVGAAVCMTKFFWRGFVLERGNSVVTHFGRRSALKCPTLTSAHREIEAIGPASTKDGINCYQIMSE